VHWKFVYDYDDDISHINATINNLAMHNNKQLTPTFSFKKQQFKKTIKWTDNVQQKMTSVSQPVGSDLHECTRDYCELNQHLTTIVKSAALQIL